ncbi:cytochrome P450 [Pseudomassariella vexata]|uniref:Cytochrome P450 n=1 Tax=Pseudomassariella vexata TaxID=1141098 RepID=A0A1Y2D9B7_9PEZI|nr:cytochrome P450 [Pseudomassariella vexata]ORY55870.1 cytochrome P450 [Pseudomassariella vexata]
MGYTTALLMVFIPLIGYLYFSFKTGPAKKTNNFPPGPPTVPFLGNLHQMPLKKSFIQFTEWSRIYGSHGLLGLQIGPSGKTVVLNNWKSVSELLDQRGAIYSSRPFLALVQYVLPPPGDVHLAFMNYGPKWRKARKTIADFLRDEEVGKLLPIQDAESSQFMHELMQTPQRYHDHVLRYFGAVIMDSVFGTRGKDFTDEGKIKRFFQVQDEWTAMLDQGSMPPCDVFPLLRYVPDGLTPWKGWKGRAEELKKRQSELYHELFEEAKARVDEGKSQESFVAGLLSDRETNGYSEVELEYLFGFMLEGGSDTTAGAFETFLLAMVAYPEIQKRAQEEVDGMFGMEGVKRGKVNAGALPFLKACFLETLRWRPILPLAIPHATTQDDVYHGYLIPANTTIIMNVWAVQHDPDEYEEPDTFNPSRFLENPLGIRSNSVSVKETSSGPSRKPSYAFGAGRRVCAGQKMAENSMMITMAKLLWTFDVVGGKEVDTKVETAYKDAILTGPNKLEVSFNIRGKEREQVVAAEWKKADEFLKRFE